jgi:hypothetical protein
MFENLSRNLMRVAGGWRARPNISYRQADLHELDPASGCDFILSVLTLHDVPDLHAALRHIKELIKRRRAGRAAGHLCRTAQGHPALAAEGEQRASAGPQRVPSLACRRPGCQLQRVGGRRVSR